MRRSEWGKPVSADEAHRRAGGRARYNATRENRASKRRQQLLAMLRGKHPRRGELASLARQCGVSKATICRDVAMLQRTGSLSPADPTFAQLLRQMRAVLKT